MKNANSRWLVAGSTAALGWVFFFWGLGGYDLTAPDEPRYALVAREMIQQGHWLLPHRNDRVYPDKPPLFFWTIAGTSLLGGGEVTAFSARLPSALAAVGILFLMFAWVRGREGPENTSSTLTAWLTLAVLVTSVRFFFQARMAQIDMLLCLCTTAALLLGYRAIMGEKVSQALLGIMLGLGILAKGPVGYLVPVGSLCLFAWWKGRDGWRNYPKKALLWGLLPPLLWLTGLAVQVLLTDQWAYLQNLLFKQTVVRFFNPWHHYKPFFYYLGVFLYDFFPWSPLLAVAIPWRKSDRKSLSDTQKLAWAVVCFTLVFFSLSKGKRNLYILPLYPFAAYLAAAHLQPLLHKGKLFLKQRLAFAVTWLALLAFGVGILLVALGEVRVKAMDQLSVEMPQATLLGFGIAVLLAALVQAVGLIRNMPKWVVAALAAAMLSLQVLAYQVVMPWISPDRSPRVFMEQVNEILETEPNSEVHLGMVYFRAAYRLFGSHPVVELRREDGHPNPGLPGLMDFWTEFPDGWVILRGNDLDRYPEEVRKKINIRFEKFLSGERFLLVTLASGPQPADEP